MEINESLHPRFRFIKLFQRFIQIHESDLPNTTPKPPSSPCYLHPSVCSRTGRNQFAQTPKTDQNCNTTNRPVSTVRYINIYKYIYYPLPLTTTANTTSDGSGLHTIAAPGGGVVQYSQPEGIYVPRKYTTVPPTVPPLHSPTAFPAPVKL